MPARQGTTGFRPDIEGLRAVAIAAVLLAHAGVPFVAGGFAGVDVFFVISGFLITGMLVREAERSGTVSLLGFYAKRATRLLPLAVLVLAVVTVLSALLLAPLRAADVADDVVASGLYVVNWHLAAQSVDYFAGGAAASPVQHFWSLAVEEQFYLLWPLLLLTATWWSRRRGRSLRPALWTAVVGVAGASLGYGIVLTQADAGRAYFSSPARAWELALGGLVALALAGPAPARPRPRPGPRRTVWRSERDYRAQIATRTPGWARGGLGWGGLLAIAAAVVLFDEDTAFPGVAALLPALGAAAIIAAGGASVGRLLERRPVRHVGRVSYAWYLWHWPLLVLAEAAFGALSVLGGVAVVAASWLPAVLSHRLVERPLHHSRFLKDRPRWALRLGVACTAIAVVLGISLAALQPTLRTAPASAVTGAAAGTASTIQASATAVRPNPAHAGEDRSQMYADGCLVPPRGTVSGSCVYGDAAARTTVVLFGDSHAMQYFPALQTVARQRGWRLVGLTKAGCTPASTLVVNDQLRRAYTECQSWRERTLRRIEQTEHPALVVTSGLSDYTAVSGSGARLSATASATALRRGWTTTLKRLSAAAGDVVVIRDGPASPVDVPDCVSGALDDLARCAFTAKEGLDAHPVDVAAARSVRGVAVVDPTPVLCPDGTCPAVIGNALVYRDTRHLTATFVKTLAPWLATQLPALTKTT